VPQFISGFHIIELKSICDLLKKICTFKLWRFIQHGRYCMQPGFEEHVRIKILNAGFNILIATPDIFS